MPKTNGVQTVLVIEDEIDIQNFISRVLEFEGYCTLKAGDGKTGLKIISNNAVDLIILDMRLPNIDGWSVLRTIKRNKEHARIPVIVLTAVAEADQRRRALRMGANQYLTKPLSALILSKAIKLILGKKPPVLPMNAEHAVTYV